MKLLNKFTCLHWFFAIVLGLIGFGTLGAAWGYSSGAKARETDLANSIVHDITWQFEMGLEDFEAGNFALAKQRFDYVIQQFPDYPGAIDMLARTILKLEESNDSALVIIPTPTIEVPPPTTTPDLRPLEEIFSTAEEQWRSQEWYPLFQTIVALRDLDPLYRVREVDRMLYLALRFNGIDKILNQGNLEGGLFDLARMERFAPLDNQVLIYQEWARLYLLGVSFWGIFPERSVEYFSQLALAAPYLRDFSNIYAVDRYRMALIQYGDHLAASGEWCLAVEQYNLAQSLVEDISILPTVTAAQEGCLYGNETPTLTLEPGIVNTPTMTLTPILPTSFHVTQTPTPTIDDTPTPTSTEITQELTPTETITTTPTETPLPTGEPTATP